MHPTKTQMKISGRRRAAGSGVRRQLAAPRSAAAKASSTSATPAVETSPTTLPSNGERTSSVAPERTAARCPPTSNCVVVNSVSSLVSSAGDRLPLAQIRVVPPHKNLRPFWTIPTSIGRSKNCSVNEFGHRDRS